MIILDTNVISGLMDVGRDPHLVSWLNQTGAEGVWITAVAVFEIKGGIDSLVASRRKKALLGAFDTFLELGFRDRVLPFDHNSAIAAAQIGAERDRRGRRVGANDTMIAGIAVSRSAVIATRNVRHFDDLPVDVINPWDAASG
jgi:hypothetical protein